MTQELMIGVMPALTITESVERYNTIVEFVKKMMKPGIDYGVVPGTDKPTLYKPGAEKLTTLFGLSTRFILTDKMLDWGDDGREPLFSFMYKCQLWRGDLLVAEAEGSCNSREKKYRWRDAQRVCPECGKPAIIKGKQEYGGGWLCFGKKGGCGCKFSDNDLRIVSQQLGQVPNPDIADQVNTIQKMAQKRALVAATLIAVNASEFFTQDVEDLDIIDAEFTPKTGKPEQPATPDDRQTHAPIEADIVQAPPKAKPVAKSENGRKHTQIKSGAWFERAKKLAARVPYYQDKNGEANLYHMAGSASKCGYQEITDENLDAAIRDLEQHAREQTQEMPQEA